MSLLDNNPNVVNVHQAAQILGVSERSVYGYIQSGLLTDHGIGGFTIVLKKEVQAFQRKPAGRKRQQTPRWRIAPEGNAMIATMIRVRLWPGSSEPFERAIQHIRQENKHSLSGTSARYLWRDPADPQQVIILLIWREQAMPPEEVRQQEWQHLVDDLAHLLDWETARSIETPVITHAEG